MRKTTAPLVALAVGVLAWSSWPAARANPTVKPRILVTGFAPFGWGLTYSSNNISWDLALSLDGKIIKGYEVVARQLPVVFKSVDDELPKLIKQLRPSAYVAFGQGLGDYLLIEERANNEFDSVAADTSGAQPAGIVVRADGPDVYKTTLPVQKILKSLQWTYPSGTSKDAGRFVCEYTFYLGRYTFDREGLPGPVGFVHVPPVDFDDFDATRRKVAALKIVSAVADALPPVGTAPAPAPAPPPAPPPPAPVSPPASSPWPSSYSGP